MTALGVADRDTQGAARHRLPLVRWSTPLLHHLAMTVDAVLLLLAVRIAGPLPLPSGLVHNWFQAVVVAGLMTVLAHRMLVRFGAYQLRRYQQLVRSAAEVACTLAVSAVAALVVAFLLTRPTTADITWLGRWALCAAALMLLFRLGLRFLVGRGLRAHVLHRKVAIVGATELAEQLIEQLADPALEEPHQVIGVFDERALGRRPPSVGNYQVRGNIDALCRYAESEPVDLIIIALPWTRAMQIWAMIQRVQWISADVVIPLERDGFNPRVAQVSSVAGTPTLQVMRKPLEGARVLLKLIEDYAVASVALVVVAPLLLLTAAAVRLSSPGPILFRQTRCGFNRQEFTCFKFRTMYVDPTDTGVVGVDRASPRITPVGRVLRRLSIDELPQLLNVLRGEMSIVGPRPHVPGMRVGAQEYTDAVREYASRYRIKPGITGWAQINGMRGGIHTVEKAARGVDLDVYYIENWSVWFDIRIMVRTLLIGMTGRDVF